MRGEENIYLMRNHIYFYLIYLVDRSGYGEHKQAQEICTSFPHHYFIILKNFWDFTSYLT